MKRTLAVAVALAAACSGRAGLQIESPQPHAHVQGPVIAVEARTSAPEGNLAFASAGGASAQARVAHGHLHFDVPVPEGEQVLQVSVEDKDARVAHASAPITSDPVAGCRIDSPADGAVITADPGDTGLAIVPVEVSCRGLGHPTPVKVMLDGWPDPLQKALPAQGGAVSFDAQLLPGLNVLTLVVPGLPLQAIGVTLRSGRCRTEVLDPPDGAVLSAALDRSALPGEQVRVVVGTSCPDGAVAKLTLSAAGGAQSVAGAVASGRATFDLTVPEGAVFAQAFVAAGPGTSGASRRSHWFVDSILPLATIEAPTAGALVSSPVAFAGRATADALTPPGVLVIDEGALEIGVEHGAGDAWQQAVPLPPGTHVARLVVTRTTGNQTVSPSVVFAVEPAPGAVTILSPLDGATLNLTTLVPLAAGARATFQLRAPGPSGRTAAGTRGATTSAAVPVPPSGLVFVPLDRPRGCGPAAFTCTASAGGLTSPAVHLTADAAAPRITLFSPPPGSSSTRQGSVEVRATTSCPGEVQHYDLRTNGAPASAGPVAANALDLPAVPIDAGADNRLDLTVTDASGNASTVTAHVVQLAGAPAVALLAPVAGATLTAADDVDHDLANGLQALVRVSVANRPAGTQVDLSVASVDAGGQPRLALHALTSAATEAVFSAVTLPEGNVTLTACVTDPVTPPVAPVCATAQVRVSTGRAVCNVAAPADGALLTAASDTRPDLPGYQDDLRVQTSGDGPVTVTLTDPDGVTTTPPPSPAGTGLLRFITFSSITFGGGDGSYTIDAVCGGANPGRALTNTVTLQAAGPVVAFVAPADGAVFNAASPDTSAAAGFQTDVQVQTSAGATVSLSVQCATLAASYGPLTADGAGKAFFGGVTLLSSDPGDDACKLTAHATLGGTQGLPSQVAVTIDRTVPAPAFTSPTAGQVVAGPGLDCTNPAAPVLQAARLALADAVAASGLTLTVNGVTSAAAPSPVSGGWSWANLALAAGSNVLQAAATDAAGNAGTASVAFTARCGKVGFAILATGTKFGWAQDKDHATPGEQLGVQISAGAPDGAAVRVCSSAGDPSQAACSTGGTFPLPPAGRVLSGGSVTFDATFPDGPQTVVAELVDGSAAPSDPKSILVRSTPPRVTALTIVENDADLSLNAAELAPTLHFSVTATGAIAGQALEIHSTALGATLLGSAVANAGQTTVAVPLSAVAGAGGYQQHVFYALVHDDAGNPDSIPGAEYPGDPAFTLGTPAQPFVIAPAPSVSLQRPAAGTTALLAADDTGCAANCPNTDPLSYLLSAQTSAPDGSQAAFLLDGAQAGAAIALAGGSVSAARLLANGPSRALAVRITDPYGNVVTSAARTVVIDSLPPLLQLQVPGTLGTVPATVTVKTGVSLEAGQVISITSDKDGLVGSAPCAANGQTPVPVSLSTTGPQQLTASAKDAAGNPGVSAPASTLFAYAGPTIALLQPPPSAQRIWFGSASAVAGRCAPLLQATTAQANGGVAVLWVAPTGDCSGSPTAEQKSVPVNGSPTTFALSFADGETGFLCARVTANALSATTSPQSFGCDLSTPAVAWSAPADNQLFVAPPLGARTAIASQGTDPLTLVADFSLVVTAPAGSTVTLADGPVFASRTLASACAGCPVAFAAAQLPVAPGGALGHTLVAAVTTPGGNQASASRAARIDIDPPADAAPSVTVTQRLGGVVHVAVASVPGDDGTAGPPAQGWQVRWSLGTPLTRANWDSTGVLLAPALVPAPGTPGTAQGFDVVLPADSAQVWLGVRAADRVGNLGGFTDQGAAPTLSLQLARLRPLAAGVPILTGNANNFAGRMRIADLDGDGFDDVVLSYPNDGACSAGVCDGRIYVYFGAAGGLANAAAPLVLTGSIAIGGLGLGSGQVSQGLGFDVGDFDGDGLPDIAASETDCVAAARIDLWTGASIKAFRATGTRPSPVVLSNGTTLLGGTVRAVGHATGGTAAGDDLLIADYTAGCSSASALALLPRGAGLRAGNANVLASAQATVTLPAGHMFGTADAAGIDAFEAGTTRQSLFVSFIDTSAGSLARELRTLAGSALASTVALTSGSAIAVPTGGGTDFGRYLGAGLDATGDGKNDLALSGDKRVFLYDGSTLLGASPQPVSTLDVNGDSIPFADVSYCAQLLPDLTGDGLAEVSGCANPGQAPEVYFAFGGSGPGFSFIDPAAPGSHRRQRIAGAGTSFGQKIGAGHVSSKSGIDLVVLSESGSGAPQLELLR